MLTALHSPQLPPLSWEVDDGITRLSCAVGATMVYLPVTFRTAAAAADNCLELAEIKSGKVWLETFRGAAVHPVEVVEAIRNAVREYRLSHRGVTVDATRALEALVSTKASRRFLQLLLRAALKRLPVPVAPRVDTHVVAAADALDFVKLLRSCVGMESVDAGSVLVVVVVEVVVFVVLLLFVA